MTLAYGWVTKTQKRISNALVGGKITRWEMQFIQTIDMKLENYKTDSRITEKQSQKLFTILTKAENPTSQYSDLASSSPSSFDLQRPHPARHDRSDRMSDADGRNTTMMIDMSDLDLEQPGSPAPIDFRDAFSNARNSHPKSSADFR